MRGDEAMQILMITLEPPLTPDTVATGNAVRTMQLESALNRAGHQVTQVWLDRNGGRQARAFRNRDELRSIIIRNCPDAILVAYWELLELLPFELSQPVVADFIAPRPLELLYEDPANIKNELHRLKANLSKCDVLLVGNAAQRNLLWFTLLDAGFDLRGCDPVLVVPPAAEVAGSPESDPVKDGWTLVSGGVRWPWRKSGAYWQAIQSMQEDPAGTQPRLVLFGGRYRWHSTETNEETVHAMEEPAPVHESFQSQDLEPYAHFSHFLRTSAHIGLEVAQYNIERNFSQSFRSIEFLRHGLPLICNDYLPIARLVSEYQAGWTIKDAEELPSLLRDVMSRPGEWKKRSDNALRLVREKLNPDSATRPLLDWLKLPAKAPLLPVHEAPGPVVLGKPPITERIRRQYGLLRSAVLSWAFRSDDDSDGDNILVVTRRDLFPTDHGAAVKIVETAKALSRHGRKVGVVSDDRSGWWLFENGEKTRCRLPFWLRLLHLPAPLARLLHMSKDIPASNAFLYLPLSDGSFFWHCLYAGKQLNPGILQAEFPAYASPCIEASKILDADVVLVEHNVEYERLKAQVSDLTDAQFANLRAIEVDLCNRSDAVVCVSDNDRSRLLNAGVQPALLHTIPHGYDPGPYELPAHDGLRQEFGLDDDAVLIAFHGTFSYPPNRDALHVFADVLLPQLAGANRPYHVIAIGRNPPARRLHPNIHCTGSVDEVGPWLKACDLAVIPLREGGGTRMKIIDCFAAGLPVISTSKGIEGIPVVNGQEALICDDWLRMTNEIIDLADSVEKREQLAAAAREFAAGLDWFSIAGRYLELFADIRKQLH
ncbi:MAG: glycosyltransferase family 4 protein [Lysobacterales bacterium]|jgi:glycosyltransferase involved in cell wall biosynthesis